MGDDGTNGQLCCAFCTDTNIRICIRCQRPYCILHTSRISPQLCQDCFKEVYVVIDKFTRVTEEYNESTDSVEQHSTSCKRIRLDGPDYVWASVSVSKSNDQELGVMLEYHKFMVSRIENERTTREVAKAQAVRDQKLVISTETSTRTKTTRRVKQKKTAEELLAMSGILPNNPAYAALLTQMKASMGQS
jgi:hypothetical protein